MRRNYKTLAKVTLLLISCWMIYTIMHIHNNVDKVDKAEKLHTIYSASNSRSYGVLGIFSADGNTELRDVQRMILSHYTSDNVIIRFVLDRPTDKLLHENRLHNDIIFIDSAYSGNTTRFGEKISKWLKTAAKLFPDADFVGRMDDDAYICDPSFKIVWENWSPLMYLGFAYNLPWKHPTLKNSIDDMFVVLGKELVRRIIERKYCQDRYKCDSTKDLYDHNMGGGTLGIWLSIYDDVNVVPINKVAIQKRGLQYIPGMCSKYFVLHRIKDPEMLKRVHADAKLSLQVPESLLSGVSGTTFHGRRHRRYNGPRLNSSVDAFDFRGDMKCSLWGVVTTIHPISKAILKVAEKMCVVIVADKKTPEDFLADTKTSNLIFLTVKDQNALTIQGLELMLHIPWNHFGRKNIGYVYAIMHGAKTVFDFDDDNILTEELPEFVKGEWYVSPRIDVFNPYPTFIELDSIPWPRGFPLSQIHNNNTWARITELKKETILPSKIGVIQSLANHEPDVDAIWRLTKSMTMVFMRDLRVILQPRTMTPYNAQATLHSALWGLLLPVTVHGRVSDIWRSYITERLLWDVGQTVGFVSPFVEQARNVHDIQADFNSEIPLYEQTEALLSFLHSWESTAPSLEERLVELYIELYERKYIEYNDIILSQAWIRTLQQVGYKFPLLRKP